MKKIELHAIASSFDLSGKRLDQVVAKLFSKYSRSYLKKLILTNQVFVNKFTINRPDKKILGGETITIHVLDKDTTNIDHAENISLDIIYEDKELLIINKPSGLVVHPGFGNEKGTILNALLYHYKDIRHLPRAGIVHRLDKDTSGLMVIAKTIFSYHYLLKLLKKRKIIREYQAFVRGKMISGGTVNEPIMRNRNKRTCMMIHPLGKHAITHYKIINRFDFYTHIVVRLETGRTHQIRVHMLHIKYPLIGDPLYHGINRLINYEKNKEKIYNFKRQALHAHHISFYHPTSHNLMSCTIPLPKDMKELFSSL